MSIPNRYIPTGIITSEADKLWERAKRGEFDGTETFEIVDDVVLAFGSKAKTSKCFEDTTFPSHMRFATDKPNNAWSYTFQNHAELLSIKGWYSKNTAPALDHTFSNCGKLQYFCDDMAKWFNGATSASWTFENCKELLEFPDDVTFNNVTSGDLQFHNCNKLATLKNIEFTKNILIGFRNCIMLNDLGKIQNKVLYLYNCPKLGDNQIDEASIIRTFNYRTSTNIWSNTKLTRFPEGCVGNQTTQVNWWFENMYNLMRFPQSINFAKATTAVGAFNKCSNLEIEDYVRVVKTMVSLSGTGAYSLYTPTSMKHYEDWETGGTSNPTTVNTKAYLAEHYPDFETWVNEHGYKLFN